MTSALRDASQRALGSYGSRDVIVLFAKLPVPGDVKTRMSPPFSLEEAADFYGEMLDDALVETGRLATRLDLCAVLSVTPGGACGEFADRIARLGENPPTRLEVVPQCGRDLAQRMEWGVAEAAARGARKVLLRGSDCPVVDDKAVSEALSALDDVDVVLSRDRGGGYGLIGLRTPAPELFRLEMSTRRVALVQGGRGSRSASRSSKDMSSGNSSGRSS